MHFKLGTMDFSRAIDEVFLRFFLLALRIIQALVTLPIIGFAAAIINDFSSAGVGIPGKAGAAQAIACVCVAYTGLSFFPIFFEGLLFFTCSAVLDALFAAAWSTLTAVWDGDGNNTCATFRQKYFSSVLSTQGTTSAGLATSSMNTDCQLTKAMFAFMIINM